jgi:I/LWEQ domain
MIFDYLAVVKDIFMCKINCFPQYCSYTALPYFSTDALDVSGITLHAAKRLEMDSQVRVLELESSLQQERLRLAALRRHHYQLAGEAEGWEKKVRNISFGIKIGATNICLTAYSLVSLS